MGTPKDAPIDLDALKAAADKRLWPKTREQLWKRTWSQRDCPCDSCRAYRAEARSKRPCRIWKPRAKKDGTGQFWFQGKNLIVHRVAWMVTYGHIPEGKKVIRTCGYKRCLEPEHLKLVDDLAEAIHKGKKKRQGKPPRRVARVASRVRWARKQVLKKRRDRQMRERALRVDAAASVEKRTSDPNR